jgi:hypothetical protein
MPVNKVSPRREYLGEHQIAQNLTLSSKTHSCKIESIRTGAIEQWIKAARIRAFTEPSRRSYAAWWGY